MSRAYIEGINVLHNEGDDNDKSQTWPDQESHIESNFVDSSGPLFLMYLEMAEEEDKKMAESWKADAEGILVFTGLFSSAVASFISVSIQDIQQNPQDTSNFYLANIYQAMIDPDRSTSLPASPPPFSPPSYAVWVNGLWFMSLVISITCAVLATLLQQWARKYLKVTQPHYSLHKRARIRSFFAEGVQKSFLPWALQALPTLLHVSLVLFFAGLCVFLWNVNLTIFKVVLSWIGACTALYGCTMLVSLVFRDSPYYTPLTPLVQVVISPIIGILLWICFLPFGFSVILLVPCYYCFFRRLPRVPVLISKLAARVKPALQPEFWIPEKAALESPPEIDTRALMWTFDRLDEDHELERFFSGFPGFYGSKFVKEPLRGLDYWQVHQLLTAMIGLFDRTFSSDSLPRQVKRRRADICTNAIDLVDASYTFLDIFTTLVSDGPVQSTETVDFVKRWSSCNGEQDEDTTLVIPGIFSIIVARVQRHDDSWFTLASGEMGVPETVLRSHATLRNNLSLIILIHVTRQQFIHFRDRLWPGYSISHVLRAASNFDVQDTSPELQHEFCALWNQMVREAQDDDSGTMTQDSETRHRILKPLFHVYIAFHPDLDPSPTQRLANETDLDSMLGSPTPYPMCNVHDHFVDESASTTFPRISLHNDNVLVLTSPTPDLPSSSTPALLHINEDSTAIPPLDNSHHTDQTVEIFRVSLTSPDHSAAGAILRDIVASDITSPYLTPETSTSAPSLSFSSLPAAISLQNNADHLTRSDPPNIPSFASNPILDNTLLAEPHRSMIVTTARNASLGPTSGLAPGIVADGDGSPKPGCHKDKDVLDPPSLDRAINTVLASTPDLPPQSPSLPPVTDSDLSIAGRSLRGPNSEHAADRPPDPSRYRYDMV